MLMALTLWRCALATMFLLTSPSPLTCSGRGGETGDDRLDGSRCRAANSEAHQWTRASRVGTE